MRQIILLSCLGLCCGCGSQTDVVVNVPNTQAQFVEYKTQDSWNKPTLLSDGYHFSTDSSYEFVVVCTDANGLSDIELLFATPGDGPQTVVPVLSSGGCQTSTTPILGSVAGQAAQAGVLSIAGVGTGSVSANWTFNILAPVGTYDAVMVPTAGPLRASVRRDVQVTADTQTSLTPFDLNNEGAALVPIATGEMLLLPNEILSEKVILQTANGTNAFISEVDESPALGLDSSITRSDDLQTLRVDADTTLTSRSATVVITSSQVVIQLPNLLSPIYTDTATGLHVQWDQDLPSGALVDISMKDTGGNVVHAVSSRASSTSTHLDIDVPDAADWRPQWSPSWLGSNTEATRVFSVIGGDNSSSSYSAKTTSPPGT